MQLPWLPLGQLAPAPSNEMVPGCATKPDPTALVADHGYLRQICLVELFWSWFRFL